MMQLDSTTRVLLRHIESMGYGLNRMQVLATGRYRFTAWRHDENPDGVYQQGERYRAEADESYQAAVQLAEMLGIDVEE